MTGGRIRKAKNYINNEAFLLTYGDGLSDVNIQELVSQSADEIKDSYASKILDLKTAIFGIADQGDRALGMIEEAANSADSGSTLKSRAEAKLDGLTVDAAEQNKPKTITMADILALARPERSWFVVGMFAAAVNGLSTPAVSILIAGLITSMTEKYGLYVQTEDAS